MTIYQEVKTFKNVLHLWYTANKYWQQIHNLDNFLYWSEIYYVLLTMVMLQQS